jgi:hypothetical protein
MYMPSGPSSGGEPDPAEDVLGLAADDLAEQVAPLAAAETAAGPFGPGEPAEALRIGSGRRHGAGTWAAIWA